MPRKARLLELAEILRSHASVADIQHFDMRFYRFDGQGFSSNLRECGTRACIAGYTVAHFDPALYSRRGCGIEWATVAQSILGLSYEEADALFHYHQTSDITRERAALALARLAHDFPPEFIWSEDDIPLNGPFDNDPD